MFSRSRLLVVAAGIMLVFGVCRMIPHGVLAAGQSYLLETPAPPTCQSPVSSIPATDAEMVAMRSAADPVCVRDHAWKLLLQLTQNAEADPRQRPSWETDGGNWKTKCQLNLNPLCASTSSQAERGAGHPSTDPGSLRAMSTVFFNRDAATWISTNQLNQGATLKRILMTRSSIVSGPGDPAGDVIPDMPRTGMVVKEIWQGFNLKSGKVFAYGPAVAARIRPDGGLPPVAGWPPGAFLSLKRVGGDLDTTTKCEPHGYAGTDADPVPLRCFPYQLTNERCDSLVAFNPSGARQVIDTAVNPIQSCAIVLVGFQIATKELRNWTWNTFWWVNDPTQSNAMAGQPQGLPSAYTHFAMNTMLTPDVLPADADPVKGVYNPYLEGPIRNGTNSNCLQCHARARFEACSVGCGASRAGAVVNGAFILSTQQPCSATGAARIAQHCTVSTSLLWSLADNQDPGLSHPSIVMGQQTPAQKK